MKYGLLIGGLSILLVACGGDDNADSNTATNSNTSSTSETSSVSEGEKVAQSSCIGCHGSNLTGGAGPDLTNLSLSKEELIDVLVDGKGSMPAGTANGSEEEVADYILSLNN